MSSLTTSRDEHGVLSARYSGFVYNVEDVEYPSEMIGLLCSLEALYISDDFKPWVICNDLFAWGCADGEDIEWTDIESLFKAVIAEPDWGADKWVCKRRNQQPQYPVKKLLKEKGAWDAEMEALPPNHYDAKVREKHPEYGLE